MSRSSAVEVAPAKPAVGDTPASGPIYRAAYAKEFPKLEGCDSLLDNFERAISKYGKRPCLGHRPLDSSGNAGPFEFLTYSEVAELVNKLASAFDQLALSPKDKIGVFGANCPEWMVAMQAMNRQNLICVPLYETLGESAVEYIVSHSEAKMVLVSAAKLPALTKSLPKVAAGVTSGVIVWGQVPQEQLEAVRKLGVSIRTWSEALELGAQKAVPPCRPTGDDICTIMYTSGTTGDPKGVQVAHHAVLATIAGIEALLEHCGLAMTYEDVVLSYLPLAHIFDRVVEEFMINLGGSIGYWQGDVKRLVSDIEALSPTLFIGVPRIFERIYAGVQDQLKKGGFLKQLIYKWAYERKLHFTRQGYRPESASTIADALVFKKLKAKLGGRVRVIVSGGAPTSNALEEFLRLAFCCPFVQGYGLTETCAASFIAVPFDHGQAGTVGPPMPSTEVRLEAVPEMGYDPLANPPRGEVCLRGPAVFSGYYKNEEMTKEVFDSDGFFHTGDIGELQPDGALKLIDRKKNIFKLSQGEYIAVEKVENAYKTSSVVEQIWVFGNSFESVLVAVIVPREAALLAWADKEGLGGKSFQALCQEPRANAWVLGEVRAAGKKAGLKGLEDIKTCYLESELFSVENDLMTATFKLKRNVLLKKYKSQIDAMYAELKKQQGAQG